MILLFCWNFARDLYNNIHTTCWGKSIQHHLTRSIPSPEQNLAIDHLNSPKILAFPAVGEGLPPAVGEKLIRREQWEHQEICKWCIGPKTLFSKQHLQVTDSNRPICEASCSWSFTKSSGGHWNSLESFGWGITQKPTCHLFFVRCINKPTKLYM